MKNLLNFIVRYSAWFVFTFYVVISCILLASGSTWHGAIYLSSANAVTGGVYEVSSGITSYFHLRSINESLQASNAELQNEVLNLKNQIAEYKVLLSDTVTNNDFRNRFDYVAAGVINNNTRHPRNFFTINKGLEDGVLPGMGVVDQNGVVGIVNVASKHTARIISLLNETQHFSVKLKDTNYIGSLSWKGADPTVAYFDEVPRHAKYNIGDTIVTSGYSTTFPEGIAVGRILTRVKGSDDSFFTFKVQLFPDFRSLSTVRVIRDSYKNEIDSLSSFDNIVPQKQ